MIKKLLVAVMIAMPAFGFAQKFGVVNVQTLTEELPEMNEVKAQLEKTSKEFENEFKTLQDEFQKKYTELQNMEESAPQTIKERRIQELQEMEQKINQFRTTATQTLQRQQEQLMAPIQQKVIEALQAVGAEGNYTMIFDNMQPLYIGKDVEDVTPLIKAKLGVK